MTHTQTLERIYENFLADVEERFLKPMNELSKIKIQDINDFADKYNDLLVMSQIGPYRAKSKPNDPRFHKMAVIANILHVYYLSKKKLEFMKKGKSIEDYLLGTNH